MAMAAALVAPALTACQEAGRPLWHDCRSYPSCQGGFRSLICRREVMSNSWKMLHRRASIVREPRNSWVRTPGL